MKLSRFTAVCIGTTLCAAVLATAEPDSAESVDVAAPNPAVGVQSNNAATYTGTPPGDFPDTSLTGWHEESFHGNTEYTLINEDGNRVLRGYTNGNASVLYKKKRISLSQTPWLSWTWKVDRTYGDIDEQSRSGDDFPARLYVVARTGFLPWESMAVNYVWSSSTPVDTAWHNPYTSKARMIAVQSGDALVDQWVLQRRNVIEDFQRLFGVNVDELDGYALMVDGDNTGEMATGYFGQIQFTDR